MIFWKTKNRIESKKEFHSKIQEYYHKLAKNEIPNEFLSQLISIVTEKIYSDYRRSWKKYPKSRKRYSSLKLDDLENPSVHFMITDFLNEKEVSNSKDYSKILFKMNDEEYHKHLDYKEWYETK